MKLIININHQPDMKRKPSHQIAKHFRNKFSVTETTGSLLESTAPERKALQEHEVNDRMERSKEGLDKLIEKYFDNDPKLKAIAKKIYEEGGDSLRAIANEDEIALNKHINNDPAVPSMLEAIVQTDGSRPSFLIRNNKIDFESSPIGTWESKLMADDNIKKAIQCVGRINVNQRHIGTGFLIHRNLIMTNRHVLQSIAQETNGKWVLHPGANIDFGYEFKAVKSKNLRRIKTLIYCGPKFIDKMKVDHSKLDMAILELENVKDEMVPLSILSWDASKTWTFPETEIVTIGYPGDPGLAGIATYTATLLDQLFSATYGFKRLAPGEIMTPMASKEPIMLAHDATTLGGNSGSVIFQLSTGLEPAACGLHYGGEVALPRENWGHELGTVLEMIKGTDPKTFNYLKKELTFINEDA